MRHAAPNEMIRLSPPGKGKERGQTVDEERTC